MNRGIPTGIEKHVSNSSRFLVDFEGMASEDDSFGDDTLGVRVDERAHRHQLGGLEKNGI